MPGMDKCTVCDRGINVMAFRKTPYCCENCRKRATGDEKLPL